VHGEEQASSKANELHLVAKGWRGSGSLLYQMDPLPFQSSSSGPSALEIDKQSCMYSNTRPLNDFFGVNWTSAISSTIFNTMSFENRLVALAKFAQLRYEKGRRQIFSECHCIT
jgi:hypothetical protein